MRETVLSAHHRATFDRARERVSAFATHASIISVLAVLSDTSSERYAERDALTLALVCEQQRAPSPLWSSALLIAYSPMLLHLRGCLVGNELAADDLDMIVVEAFLDAVAQLQAPHRPGRTAIRLRRAVRRSVFRVLNDERARFDTADPFEDELELHGLGDFVASEGGHEPDEDDQEEMRRVLYERAGRHLSAERLELVAETYLRGEPLTAYVARTRADLDGAARSTEYERLKRDRLRSLKKLRVLLRGAERERVVGGARALAPEPSAAR
jgi:hypothetical protein